MNYKSKYSPERIRKQYNTGGYGNADYGSNTYEAQYNAERINKLNTTTTGEYNKNQKDLYSSYLDNLQASNKEIMENLKLQSQVKSGINLALSGKMDNDLSYKQNINDWATNKLGLDRGEVAADFSRDLSGGYNADATVLSQPTGTNFTNSFVNQQGVTEMHNAYGFDEQGWNNLSSENQAAVLKQKPSYSTVSDPGGIGQYTTDQSLSDAERRYQKDNPPLIGPMGPTGKGYIDLGNSAGPRVPSGTSVKGDFIAPKPTPKAPLTLNTVPPGSPIKPNTITPGGGSAPAATPTVAPATTTAATTASTHALSAGNAPIKGGGWTMAVDMGLDYLSNDNDVSTYTAGEVGTDIASLALSIGTYNWVGAGLKLWDMGSQMFGRNKAATNFKNEKTRLRKEDIDLGNEYTEDMHANAEQIGSHKSHFGKRAVYGSGELGGFNYNI